MPATSIRQPHIGTTAVLLLATLTMCSLIGCGGRQGEDERRAEAPTSPPDEQIESPPSLSNDPAGVNESASPEATKAPEGTSRMITPPRHTFVPDGVGSPPLAPKTDPGKRQPLNLPDSHLAAPETKTNPTPRALRNERPASDEKPPTPANATISTPDSTVAADTVNDSRPYTLTTVFYATDRAVEAASASFSSNDGLGLWPLAIGLGMTVTLILLGLMRSLRRWMWSLALFTTFATIGWSIIWVYGQLGERARSAQTQRVRYGNERGVLQLGTCVVSIPKSHKVGEVETPSILRLEIREDARKHVVLQRVEPQPNDTFFKVLRDRVRADKRHEVFVFVHGYNVTFDNAARRTAQIAHDVQFSGAPIFFSWPSQGGLLEYTVDETNVAWAVPHLKQFLLEVVRQSGAESVNLIAHSMGNRALTRTLQELEMQFKEESTLFNQVILAAPDVDAEIFRRDLAPALIRTSKHVTLYASSTDQALAASKQVHGYARAGDSGAGLLVIPGIDTIDVSTVDTSFLGHSYYGSSNPILKDIYYLFRNALPAARRGWLQPMSYNGLTYWVFQQIRDNAARTSPEADLPH